MNERKPGKEKILDWSQFYRLLIFFAVLLPIGYLFLFVYRPLVVPFFLSLFFSYILVPFVDRLDRYRVPRVAIVSVILLLAFTVVGVAVVEVLPYLYAEVLNLMRLAPKVFAFVNERVFPFIKNYFIGLGFVEEKMLERLLGEMQAMVQWSDRIQDALTSIWRSAPQVVGTLVNVIMTPLITFFLVKDEKQIVGFLRDLTPVDLRRPLGDLLKRISRTLHALIKGQITVAAILAILYVIGLSMAGVHAGIAIGLVAGACRLIPYLDVIVGGLLSLIVIFSNWQGFGQLFFVIGVFAGVQALDGMLITPRVVGERLGIHPLFVIVTVIGFGDLWGFWGVLLAVPTIAILKVFLLSFKPYYVKSRAFGLQKKKS